jgi:hypothetical protein
MERGLALLFCFALLSVCLIQASDTQALEIEVSTDTPIAMSGEIPFDPESGREVVGYVARVGLDDPDQVYDALERAEALYLSGGMQNGLPPITFILHGPEVSIFYKENYQEYKSIVDLAARLKAFEVVDVRVCASRMRSQDADETMVYPFVGTVIYGPKALEQLLTEKHYTYF